MNTFARLTLTALMVVLLITALGACDDLRRVQFVPTITATSWYLVDDDRACLMRNNAAQDCGPVSTPTLAVVTATPPEAPGL